MATTGGPRPDDLSLFARLAEKPEEHHVFQALRIIEAEYSGAPRLGTSRRPREDRVRLGQAPELAFPPSTLRSFTPPTDAAPGRLTNRFFGLFGPHGPLPLHLTEFARDRQRNHRDGTFVGFVDMITHRMMGLLYRAWSSARPAPSFDRGDDPFEQKVAAFAGYRGAGFADRDAMPDLARRHFTGLLSQGTRTPEGLVAIVSAFLEAPVRVQQFVGTWLELEPGDTWQLGRPAGLGQGTSIGNRVWSRTSKFRLIIGPVPMRDYQRLLPGGDTLARLTAVVRSYVGDALEWDINLLLAGDEVPRACLAREGAESAGLGGATRLGHTSWIRSRDDNDGPRPDAADLYLYPVMGAQ
jgi:type VI secretion system protein ImpH